MLIIIAGSAQVVRPKCRVAIRQQIWPLWLSDWTVRGAIFRSLGRLRDGSQDNRMSLDSLRCSTLLPSVDSTNVDCTKARGDLGWQPEPIEKSLREAVEYYLSPVGDGKPV